MHPSEMHYGETCEIRRNASSRDPYYSEQPSLGTSL